MSSDDEYSFKKILRRWNLQLGKTFGFQPSGPKFMIIVSTTVIILIQLLIFIALSSTSIYCRLPNMRQLILGQRAANYEKLPTIYVITPTYERYVQKAELVRLSHTFMLVPNLHWILVEDSQWRGDVVSKLVRKLKNDYDFHTITHLQEPTPDEFKLKPGEPTWKRPKGIWQRNKALDWIQENLVDLDLDGVVYFADDDNTYDLELFNEMRYTGKVSVWPVAFVGGMLVEKPIVKLDKVESFNSMWKSKRPFPLDMAGFSLSLRLFMSRPQVRFSADKRVGYVESNFLSQLVASWSELEPKADKCTKVLVWHTKTQPPTLHEERKLTKSSLSDLEW